MINRTVFNDFARCQINLYFHSECAANTAKSRGSIKIQSFTPSERYILYRCWCNHMNEATKNKTWISPASSSISKCRVWAFRFQIVMTHERYFIIIRNIYLYAAQSSKAPQLIPSEIRIESKLLIVLINITIGNKNE